jgi:fatty-acyl-CoA synthase
MTRDLACDWVRYHADRNGGGVALQSLDDETTTTWAELDDRVSRLASVLAHACGVKAGERVALLAESDPRVFEVQFACMRIGAVFVPLNWRLAKPELEALMAHAAPRLIVHDGSVTDAATHLSAARGVPTLAWNDARCRSSTRAVSPRSPHRSCSPEAPLRSPAGSILSRRPAPWGTRAVE